MSFSGHSWRWNPRWCSHSTAPRGTCASRASPPPPPSSRLSRIFFHDISRRREGRRFHRFPARRKIPDFVGWTRIALRPLGWSSVALRQWFWCPGPAIGVGSVCRKLPKFWREEYLILDKSVFFNICMSVSLIYKTVVICSMWDTEMNLGPA